MSIITLKNKKDIARVFSTGITVSDAFLRLKIVPNKYTYMRVVLCVSKRLRYNERRIHKPMCNTQKRRIRALISAEHTMRNKSFDVAIITKDVSTPFYVLRTSFVSLVNMFIKKNTEEILLFKTQQ